MMLPSFVSVFRLSNRRIAIPVAATVLRPPILPSIASGSRVFDAGDVQPLAAAHLLA
jgi:hypothetical protein